ncbi:patatin-like phospholipase family protein [Bacillota bacterium LX-D]|nr:patatin-like phospholipase family protein [Bacillota bacterium LX-D]
MKVGIALGGGGLRGFAHIGVLEVLLANGIEPDIVAGTSAGSIVGSLFASGVQPKQIINFLTMFSKLNFFNLEKNLEAWPGRSFGRERISLLPKGLVSTKHLEDGLQKLLGQKNFDQLDYPLAVVASDLNSGNTVIYTTHNQRGHDFGIDSAVVETGVLVKDAVAASCAIPGIFTPKVIGTRTLVDGGLVDNVPADILRAMGADMVIAIEIGFAVEQERPINNMLDVLLQSYDIMGHRLVEATLPQYADVIIKPTISHVSLTDMEKVPGIIEAGRRAANAKIKEIKRLLKFTY